ncbi:hypothetical protein HNQ56_004431 [Anaerotaenia torta]|uniref:hypothetical protein n=1 Tax=Anaerotaenia torta TaxID=433293 RepID=UPI003D25FAD6
MSGYGFGTSARDHYATLLSGGDIKVSIVNNAFVLTNNVMLDANISIIALLGNLPVVT